MQKKNEIYEEKKKLIMKNMNPDQSRPDKNKFIKSENRQNNSTNGNYDPDYNRNLNRPLPQPILPPQNMQNLPQPIFQQPIMQNPMMAQQNMGYGNFGGYPQPNNPMMKFPPPAYQNFPQNNILNDLSFQKNNSMPPQNTLLNQLVGYNNNYGMYPPNTNMNLGMFPPQSNMQQPNFNQNMPTNFQGNPYGEIKRNPMPNIIGEKKPVIKENQVNLEKILNDDNFPTLEQAVQKH